MDKKLNSPITGQQNPLIYFFEMFKESSAKLNPEAEDSTKYRIEQRNYQLMVELENKFDQELICLLSGLESVGYVLGMIGSNDDAGLEENQLSALGWMIKSVSRLANDLQYMQNEATHIISHAEIG